MFSISVTDLKALPVIETYLEGVLFVTEKLLISSVFCSGGSTIGSEPVGTNARQNTFPTLMYLLASIFF